MYITYKCVAIIIFYLEYCGQNQPYLLYAQLNRAA